MCFGGPQAHWHSLTVAALFSRTRGFNRAPFPEPNRTEAGNAQPSRTRLGRPGGLPTFVMVSRKLGSGDGVLAAGQAAWRVALTKHADEGAILRESDRLQPGDPGAIEPGCIEGERLSIERRKAVRDEVAGG